MSSATAAERAPQGPISDFPTGGWQAMIGGLFSVKNTFIEIRETQPEGPRRSQSQPASSRVPELPAPAPAPEARDAEYITPPSTPRQKPADDEERLLCLECCDTESTAARSETSEAHTASTASSTPAATTEDLVSKAANAVRGLDGFVSKQPLMTQEALASYCQAETLLDLLAPQLPSRQSASCDVRPWLLPAPPSLPALPDFFMQHTGQVVMYAAALLAASASPVIDVHTTRDRKGWSIVAKLRPEDLVHTEQVVSWAKQAILQAAEQSICVYVMGHRRDPFRQRPHGFGAVLGLMQDEHMACWDVYNTGCCRREPSCQWTHPASVKRLYFVVRPLVPEGVDPWSCFKEMEGKSGEGKEAEGVSAHEKSGMDAGEEDGDSFDSSPRNRD